jgi:hypothetical protein
LIKRIDATKPTGSLSCLAGLPCLLAGPAFTIDAGCALPDVRLHGMPPDVAALAEREHQCRSWTTVKITNEATDRTVQLGFVQLRCDNAEDMAALRLKYTQSPPTLRALDAAGDIGP